MKFRELSWQKNHKLGMWENVPIEGHVFIILTLSSHMFAFSHITRNTYDTKDFHSFPDAALYAQSRFERLMEKIIENNVIDWGKGPGRGWRMIYEVL